MRSITKDAAELMKIADASTGAPGTGHSPAFETKLHEIVNAHIREDRIANQRYWAKKMTDEANRLEREDKKK